MPDIRELKFVGRGDEIKRLNSFVFDKVAGGILLLVGRKGMGKSRLVKQYYNNLGHSSRSKVGKLLFKVAEHWSPEVYFTNLLVEVSRGKFLWGSRKEWADLVGNIPEVGPLLKMLLSPKTVEPAPDKFFKVLKTVAGGLGEEERLVIFLDPDKYLKPESLSVFRYFRDSIPNSVKFIIPQRPEDVLFSDAEFCSNQAVDILELQEIAENDRDELYHEAMPSKVFEKGLGQDVKRLCGGWPIFVEDIGKLLRRADDVEKEFKEIDAQKLDLLGAQSRLFEPLLKPECKRERWAVYRMSILSEAQDRSFLGDYLSIEPDEVGDFLTSEIISDAIKVSEDDGVKKYQLYHQTFNEYVQKRIGDEKDVYLGKLHKEAAATFFKRIEKDRNDAEALTEYTYHLKESGDRRAFIEGLDTVTDDKHRVGLYFQLHKELSEALSYKEMNENELRKTSYLNYLGLISREMGKLQEALNWHRQALEIVKRTREEHAQAAQYANIGQVLETRADFRGALKQYRKALEINERIGRSEGIAINYSNIGNVFSKRGELTEALKNYRKALATNKRSGNLSGVAVDYGNIGQILAKRGRLKPALQWYSRSMEIFKKTGDASAIAAVHSSIGLVLLDLEDRKGALDNHKKALEINRKIGADPAMARNYANIGSVHYVRGEFGPALESYGKSLEINETVGNPLAAAQDYGNIGNVLLDQEKVDEALNSYTKALSINQQIGCLTGMASDYGSIGLVLAKQGRLDEAVENEMQALEIFKKTGERPESAHMSMNIASLYARKGDLVSASLLELQALVTYLESGMTGYVQKARHNLVISIRRLKEARQLEAFLREVKDKLGEEPEKLLRPLLTADETDSPSA